MGVLRGINTACLCGMWSLRAHIQRCLHKQLVPFMTSFNVLATGKCEGNVQTCGTHHSLLLCHSFLVVLVNPALLQTLATLVLHSDQLFLASQLLLGVLGVLVDPAAPVGRGIGEHQVDLVGLEDRQVVLVVLVVRECLEEF